MDRRTVRRTPYQQAQQLIGWARDHWADVDGRALMAGVDLLGDLPFDRALNVITTLAVDDHIPLWSAETRKGLQVYDRRRVRRELFDSLSRQPAAAPPPTGSGWDPDTWGTLPEHQRSMRAAMAFVGELS